MRFWALCLLLVMVLTAGATKIATAAEIISFATKPMGGIVYSLSAGMASIFTKYADVQVRVEPIQSIKQWGPLMQRGEVDLAFDNAVDSGGAYRAEGFFKVGQGKLTKFRLVAAGHETLMCLWTSPATGIKSIKDFEGKRVVLVTPPGAPTTTASGKYLVDDYYKLEGKYKKLEIGSPAECTTALIEGRIDVYQFPAGPHIEELKRSVGVVPIPIPKEAAEYVGQKVPGIYPGVVPKGVYGLTEDLPCIAWRGIVVAREDLNPELVYKLMNALYSHLDELHAVHPLAKPWVLANATKSPTVPFHPGAIKFYKEKGIWTPELDKIQEKNLADGK
jgi:uncharacterized protein